MSDIFLCYSRTDTKVAELLEQRLQARGWSVYRDVQTHVGERWDRKIERELHAARAVVVLWSEKSRDSEYVLEEAEYGKRKGILFPAFIERVEYPYGFARIQTADLIGWAGEIDHAGLRLLLDSLKAHLQGAEAPKPKIATPPRALVAKSKTALWLPGQTFRDPLASGGEGPLMATIPPGQFQMGSPETEPERSDAEGPRHLVTIAYPFAMGVYAVTFDEYDRYCELAKRDKPEDGGWGRGNRPVIYVSWNDAQDYCSWLSEQTGQQYRLPSEAEWEYVCRAGTATSFHFGGQLTTEQANYNGNYPYQGSAKGVYRGQTVPVGSFPPNDFGLRDMHGNVWEWCQDSWHGNYQGAPVDGSAWKTGGTSSRVLRGGSWFSNAGSCRAAASNSYSPDDRNNGIGFRVCRAAPIE